MFANPYSGYSIICLIYILRVFCFASEKTCAVLHNSENGEGNQFVLTEGQHISSFEEHYLSASQDVWNLTKSLTITQECKLTLCNHSYFGGVCKVFQYNESELIISPEILSVGSAICTCQSVCQCTDIKLKRSECARAYLDGGCSSCNSYYLDLRNGSGDGYIEEWYKNNISAFVIRPECKLEIFEEEDFEGESYKLKGIVQNWDEQVGSYKCTCTSPPPSSNNESLRKTFDPNLIDVPDSVDEIKTLLREHQGHEGLISSLQSVKSKRSPKNAYILLLGMVGAGKSSTVNMLFGNQKIIPIWGTASYTAEIQEFRIPVPLNDLGLNNSELRIIEIPGLGDTRGYEQDAQTLASLEEFLNGHEELSKYIPNVILILSRFSYRIRDPSTIIRRLNVFMDRLTDKKFSNVIFVMSHFMMEVKKIRRQPSGELKAFKSMIESFSLAPKPITIVLAENKAREEGLPKLDGSYKLPNGDFYPKNLYDKIQFATKFGGDPIGEAIFRTAYQNTEYLNESLSSFSSFRLVHSIHPQTLKHLRFMNGQNYRWESSEVSRSLEREFGSINKETLKTRFPESLMYLKKFFHIRNIHTLADIPRTNVGILKLFRQIRTNELMPTVLENAFSIKIPEFSVETLMVGCGYDVVGNLPLLSSPFKTNATIMSDIVFKMPDFMMCRIQKDRNRVYPVFNTNYLRQSLNVQQFFRGQNIIKNSNTERHTLSALQEYRNFEVSLNDNYDLSDEFLDAVNQLPPFEKSNHEGIKPWNSFFKRFGTHVVKSVYGGGSIEIQMKSKMNRTAADAIFNIIDAAEDITSRINFQTNYDYSLKFKGGDFNFHVGSFSGMSASEAADLIEKWRNSLQYNPIALDSDIKLIPISEIVKKLGLNKSIEVAHAISAFLNSTSDCSS